MPPLRPAADFCAFVPPWLVLRRRVPLPELFPPLFDEPGELVITITLCAEETSVAEHSVPAKFKIPDDANLTDAVFGNASEFPDKWGGFADCGESDGAAEEVDDPENVEARCAKHLAGAAVPRACH